jgi:hypothetical protein
LLLWLRVLTVLAAVAAMQALVLPRWPRAVPLPSDRLTTQLRRAGWQPSPLPPLPARRSYERATSPILRWRLGNGDTLQLMAGSVRQRTNFQAAFLIRDEPSLALNARRLDTPLAGSSAGRIGRQNALQTCLVPGVMPPQNQGVTAVQLGHAGDRLSGGGMATWQRLIGLRANRELSCILVSLQGRDGRSPDIVTWTSLLKLLQVTRFS